MTEAKLDRFRCSDAELRRIEAAGLRSPEAALVRTSITNSRLSGADFGQAVLEDCYFEAVKLDGLGLRFATLKRVIFRGCNLRDADFTGAKMTHVVFTECDLSGANFDRAVCRDTDMRGEKVADLKGVNGLKGVRFTQDQLIELAPLLAADFGLLIEA